MDRLAFDDNFRIHVYTFRPINSCHNISDSTKSTASDQLLAVGELGDRYVITKRIRERKRMFVEILNHLRELNFVSVCLYKTILGKS